MFTAVDRIQLASGLNAMLGAWLVISPWMLGFTPGQAATGNSIVIGVAIALLGVARAYGAYRTTWLSWLNVLLGGWLVLAPWVLMYGHDAAAPNSAVVGITVLVLAAWSAMAEPTARKS